MNPSLAHTQEWVRAVVRSGLLGPEALYAEVESVLRVDHPAEAGRARQWIDREVDSWVADAAGWDGPTDYDRVQSALAALEDLGIVVMQAIPDHWAVKTRLAQGGVRGAAWFTAADVWHAVDEPMLEVNIWHASGANAAPGDELLDDALACFRSAGLAAVFDEGRIEVGALWQRRPAT